MSVTKLNKPLIIGGKQVYPQTSADQILKADGSALETANGISVNYADNAGNADTLENLSVSALISKMYPVGSTYVTSTNENPASYLGGSWTLVDKEFENKYISNISSYLTLDSNCSAVTGTAYLSNHHITFRISFTPTVALTDSTLTMFTIDLPSFGASRLNEDHLSTHFTDGGQTVIVMSISTAGAFRTTDVFVRNTDSPNSLATGYTVGMSTITIEVRKDYMLDSFCDKFYWKRTA